jgi:DNA helicase-2/ATP-dependent DNA helicase PcrA
MRAKAHGAMLRILEDRQAELAAWCRQRLQQDLAGRPDAGAVLAFWDAAAGPVDLRVTAFAQWVRDGAFEPAARAALDARTRDVIGEWAGLLTDRAALGAGFARYAPALFSPGQLDDIHRWCVERDRLRAGGRGEDDEPYALDAEDDALLLRIYQLQRGRLGDAKGPLAYEHLMVDEVQDFSPLELAVLLDTTSRLRSVTLAGDTAQAIAPEHGFSSWSELLDHLGIAHERVEPLRVSYRSTREIVDCAEHVLGPLQGDVRPVAPRAGAPVEYFGFASAGECAEFLSHAPLLRGAGARRGAVAEAGRRSGLLVHVGDRRHRREADQGAGVRHRHPAGSGGRVVSGQRRRAPPPARGHDPGRPPALGHVHRRGVAAAARFRARSLALRAWR